MTQQERINEELQSLNVKMYEHIETLREQVYCYRKLAACYHEAAEQERRLRIEAEAKLSVTWPPYSSDN